MGVSISNLWGSNGFRLDAESAGDAAGYWLDNAGDVNGDGVDDLIIGARLANSGTGQSDAGRTYILFGTMSGFPASIDLSSLTGTTGVIYTGFEISAQSGRSVAGIGDINNDGFDDVAIGSPFRDVGSSNSNRGETYIIYGSATPASMLLSATDGTNGFKIPGLVNNGNSGWSVSAVGDANADGIDDFIVTGYREDPGGVNNAGSSYLIFGTDGSTSPFPASFDLSSLDGSNGIRLDGDQPRVDTTNYGSGQQNDLPHNSGYTAAGVGDVNNDGIDDFAVAAFGGDGPFDGSDGYNAGETFIVFGSSGGYASGSRLLSTVDGTDGFRLDGVGHNDRSGYSVDAAGDVNGDGIDDLIIGARWTDQGGNTDAGAAYVVFGRDTTQTGVSFSAVESLGSLDGTNGFLINGLNSDDWTGGSVRGIGDMNGDGIDDIAVGAHAEGSGSTSAGHAYVIFGSTAAFGATFDLTTIDGINGLTFDGIADDDRFGRQVAGTDINGDGVSDLVIGAELATSDGNADSGQAYVVFGQSDGIFSFNAPVAGDTSTSGDEDTVLSGAVTATDADPLNTVTMSLDTGPTDGTAVVNGDGTFTYTPDADFNGTDSFVVLADDGKGGTDTATVSVTVNAVNDDPVATPDTPSGDEDTVITGAVTATDVENDTVTFTEASAPTDGVVTVNTDGTYSYTPNADFNGTDAFDVTADDGNGGMDTVTVNVTVNAVNDGPVATPDTPSGDEDTVITGAVTATDVDADTVTFTEASAPTDGVVTVNSDGTYSYTPNADFNGADAFDVTADDGNGGLDTVTVNVTVNAVNDDPVATPDAPSGDEDTVITGAVTATDVENDTVTFTEASAPTDGVVTVNSDGTYSYTPNADFNGTDAFDVTADDGNGGMDTVTVNVTVNAVNDDPVATPDTPSGDEDTVITGAVTATDVDADTVAFAEALAPTNGTVTVNTDGTYSYIPNADFNGTDAFDVTADDGNGGLDTVTVNVTVNAVNDDPVATPDAPSGDEDTVITGAVTATDVENDTVTFSEASAPTDGVVTVNTDGTYSYTPNADFNGTDAFDVTADDGNGGSDTVTVNVTVNAVNDAPVITSGSSLSVVEGTIDTIDVAATDDNESEGSGLVYSLSGGADIGQFDIDPVTGVVSFQSAPDYSSPSDANGDNVYEVQVQVEDLGTLTDTQDLFIDVLAAIHPVEVCISFGESNNNRAIITENGVQIEDVFLGTYFNAKALKSTGYTLYGDSGSAETAQLTMLGAALGVRTDPSDTYNERRTVEGTETVRLTMTDLGALRDATNIVTTFGNVSGSGGISMDFYDDGVLVDQTIVNFSTKPVASYTLSGADYDEVIIGTTGTLAVELEEICFTRGGGDPAGSAPVAVDDTATMAEDGTPVAINILANDSDVDNNPLTPFIQTGPTNGTVSLDAAGVATYTPIADFFGTDSFTYTLSDGTGGTDVGSVDVTVTPTNDAPVAVDDAYATVVGTPLTVAAQGVLANDSDIDGDVLSAALQGAGPANGSVTLNSDGSFTYTPDPGFVGQDSFDYMASDGLGGTDTATATIDVDPVPGIETIFDFSDQPGANRIVRYFEDGALISSDPQNVYTASVTVSAASVTFIPDDPGGARLSFLGQGMSVRGLTSDDETITRERRRLDDNETITVDMSDTATVGDASSVAFTFNKTGGSGDLVLTFLDEGIQVDQSVIAVTSNSASHALASGQNFDEMVIGVTGAVELDLLTMTLIREDISGTGV